MDISWFELVDKVKQDFDMYVVGGNDYALNILNALGEGITIQRLGSDNFCIQAGEKVDDDIVMKLMTLSLMPGQKPYTPVSLDSIYGVTNETFRGS
jgi:hypothetical protein